MDRFTEFVEKECIVEVGQKIRSSILFNKFTQFIKEEGNENAVILTNTSFTRYMKKHFTEYIHKRECNGNIYYNITIASEYKETI